MDFRVRTQASYVKTDEIVLSKPILGMYTFFYTPKQNENALS